MSTSVATHALMNVRECECVLRSHRYENLTTKKTRSLVHELGIATVGSVTLVRIHYNNLFLIVVYADWHACMYWFLVWFPHTR